MLRQIDISKYILVDKLSKDNNDTFLFNLPHTTLLAREPSNEQNYVIIKEFTSISTAQFSLLARKIESISKISHPCIAKALGFYQGHQQIPPSIIYTFYQLRSVKNLIESFKSNTQSNIYQFFNGTHFMKICYGVAYAMNLMHLHNPPFIHRDLRAGTVLLTSNYEPCLGGYGIAEINSDKKYLAPEIIANKKSNAFLDPNSLPPADIYAYGVLVTKLLKTLITSCNIVNENDLISLNCFRSLALKCKSNNPISRPKSSEILMILDGDDFLNSLRNIQNCNFDRRNYSNYRSLLLTTPPSNCTDPKDDNCCSDIDSVFGPVVQINPFLHQEHPNLPQGEKREKRKKKSFFASLFPPDNLELPKVTGPPPKLETAQMMISSKTVNKMYPAQVASQLINSQPRTSRRSVRNQSFPDNYNQRETARTPRTPMPPTKTVTYAYTNQPQIQPSINPIDPYGVSEKTYSQQNLFSSDDDNANNNRNKNSSNEYNEFDNFLRNQNQSQNNDTKDSNDLNEFDNFLKSQDKSNAVITKSSSSQLNNSTFPSPNPNSNNIISSSKSSVSPELSGSRFLGGSFLFGGNSTTSKRSIDDIYEEAIHNDTGDTVYLNIIRATKLFKEAADRGHVDSMYKLGMKLYKGLGIHVDVGEATKYFLKSWKEGKKSESLAQLAEIYITDKKYRNVEDADKYLKEALNSNDLYANYLVVKLFVENNKYNYFYCSSSFNKNKDIETAAREAANSLRFCLKNQYKPFSPIFIEFARIAPKSFFDSLENDAKKDPSAMFYLGMLHHLAIVDKSSPFKAISFLENSFKKNYRPAFDYFVDNNLNPSSSSSDDGCYEIIKGAKIAKSGREAEAISYLRSGSESCNFAPDYETIRAIVNAMKSGKVDTRPVIDLLTRYAENGSGPAKEELGMLLVQGTNTDKSVVKGLYYLKSAFDDENYDMRNYEFLHVNCPGFYFKPSS